MMNTVCKNLCLLMVGVLISVIGAAQTGSVVGEVNDGDGGFGLPGANVYLKGSTSTGTNTDYDGKFVLTNVPVGEQVIVISYVSYATEEIPVTVVEGENTSISVELKPESILGTEVVITAQALGQVKAINQQLNSDAIGNFISVEKIKELPDVNAAEAISRLPGVAINRSGGEGSKIVVRGLDPKFTAISINGVRLPSTSGADRSVDLSLISPELLSGVELFKSPTPDMDGDAIGGSVNLNIMRAPEDRKIAMKVLGGANFLENTFTDYKATLSFSQRFFDNKLGVIATANTERFNRGGETIRVGWTDNTKNVIDTALNIFEQQGSSLTYVKRKEQRYRTNGTLGFDFKIGNNSDFNVLGLYSRTSRDRFDHIEQYNVGGFQVRYNPNVTESSIDLFSGSITARHRSNIVNVDWGTSVSRVSGMTPIDYTQTFNNNRSPFDPEVNSENSRRNPFNYYNFLDIDPTSSFLLQIASSTSGNSEEITTGYVNFDFNVFKRDANSINFKAGVKAINTMKDRNYDEERARLYYLLNNNRFLPFDENGQGATGVDPTGKFYYAMSNFQNDTPQTFTNEKGEVVELSNEFDPDRMIRFSELFADDLRDYRYQDVNNYDLEEQVYAAYAMLKAKIKDKITLIPGIRYEYSDNSYNGLYADLDGDFGESGNVQERSAEAQYGVLMPHLHLKYKPFSWFDLRASYSTTLARPNYDYLVPATIVNRGGDLRIEQGNPDLKPSVSTNYDLFATAYSGKWGLISAGVFYKQIKDAFYPFIIGLNSDSLVMAYGFPEQGFGNAELTTFVNSPVSNVQGFELDIQTNLNFLPKPFDGLVLSANYTRLFSQTTINSFREETVRTGVFPFFQTQILVIPFQREVDLIGQARHIFNTSLGYDIGGFSFRTSAAYQGSKLTGYSSNADKDRFSNQFWRFDMVFKQRFNRNFNAFLNLNNLSDQKDINFFRSPEFITNRERYGSTATIGVEYIIR
ncbi:TonB-dependent receptor [Portibacter marinus]|uniref:TonB-dependent receptor n=1 Tax=Portibacter marinus TaxID=2898660 RepID=UPI001F2D43BC|nr:TonB-dependent receptor [Portibacter marinus]